MKHITTSDGQNLAYRYVETQGDKAVILLHMLDQHKDTWYDFPEQLKAAGFSSIAIDFRGHGDSDGDWHQFSEEDFAHMVLDVEAAQKFLQSKTKRAVSVIGGSIGANVAFNFAAKHNEIKTAILLAPGENYRGVETLTAASSFNSGRHILVVVSEDDANYVQTGKNLFEAIKTGNKELKVYPQGGHGTRLLPSTDLPKIILDWLNKHG